MTSKLDTILQRRLQLARMLTTEGMMLSGVS